MTRQLVHLQDAGVNCNNGKIAGVYNNFKNNLFGQSYNDNSDNNKEMSKDGRTNIKMIADYVMTQPLKGSSHYHKYHWNTSQIWRTMF